MTHLPNLIHELLEPDANVDSVRAISGGDINEAYLVALNDGSKLFLKANSQNNLRFFEAEKTGLSAIRDTNTIRVPEVLRRALPDTTKKP